MDEYVGRVIWGVHPAGLARLKPGSRGLDPPGDRKSFLAKGFQLLRAACPRLIPGAGASHLPQFLGLGWPRCGDDFVAKDARSPAPCTRFATC